MAGDIGGILLALVFVLLIVGLFKMLVGDAKRTPAERRAQNDPAREIRAERAARRARSVPMLTCPTCGGHDVYRITGGRKAARVATIGIFAAPKVMKSFECRTCKGRW